MKRAPPVRSSSAFLKMADGLCTGDAARRNAIEEQQRVKQKRCRNGCENKTKVDRQKCGRANGFIIGSVSDKLCGDDGLCPKHEEGFLVEEMPTEDDCRKKRCVDRYDSSESSDRYARLFLWLKFVHIARGTEFSSQVEATLNRWCG